jgi:CBS domain-containing protein
MKVADLMDTRFQFVGPETPIKEAQKVMILRRVNYLVVSETGDRLAGLVTHADIFRKLLPSQTEYMEMMELRAGSESTEDRYKDFYFSEVSSIMTTRVVTIRPNTALMQAGALMNSKRIKQLPVLDGDQLVGVITSRDLSAGILFRAFGH